ncbi:hypothetical protein FSP39_008974 [Pinctada imbricata]|uniref:RA-GEF-1 n=1 Tax=Pinctada imbricata TaxID=66713 RepID=A0AA88XQU9_PINIB|nr:hypothetical protein FSP39_008974 [Pinctada imbricata]
MYIYIVGNSTSSEGDVGNAETEVDQNPDPPDKDCETFQEITTNDSEASATQNRAADESASLHRRKKSSKTLKRLNSFGNIHPVDVSNFFEGDREVTESNRDSSSSVDVSPKIPVPPSSFDHFREGNINHVDKEEKPKRRLANLKRSKSELSYKILPLPAFGSLDRSKLRQRKDGFQRTYGKRVFCLNNIGFSEGASAQWNNTDMSVPLSPPEIRVEPDGSEDDGNWSLTDSADSFGKRTPGCTRRASECLILEPSEMIVIDYPDVQVMKSAPRQGCSSVNIERMFDLDSEEARYRRMHSDTAVEQLPQDYRCDQFLRNDVLYKRGSRASDTSSAYSGSDMMQSSIDDQESQEIDLSGLPEGQVDSDDDEDRESTSESIRDTVQDCLQKDPLDRTDDDIEVLLEFIKNFRAFANMTLPIRRALCSVMVFAVIDKKGTIVMRDGEELDSWSVILNGSVEIIHPDGSEEYLQMGDSFGITPTLEKLYHHGEMRTLMDDCQFVCIAQQDYHKILDQGKENTQPMIEDGNVVMVTEHRVFDGGNRKGQIVIRGTPEHLMQHLVQEHSAVDPTYVEDFLLCYRVFLHYPKELTDKLLYWFDQPPLRSRVIRVVLLWVNNHFIDFETNSQMCEFLEHFEGLLEREELTGQLRLLNIACAAKARPRNITLTRATRDEVLHFSILGGQERGTGIFISKVEKGSKAYEAGLKRGDQILEANGSSLGNVSHSKALEILRGTTHLSVTVQSNLLDFKELLEVPDRRSNKTEMTPNLNKRLSAGDLETFSPEQTHKEKKHDKKDKRTFNTLGRHFIRKMGSLLPRNFSSASMGDSELLNRSDESLYNGRTSRQLSNTSSSSLTIGMPNQHLSASNPDLSSAAGEDPKPEPDLVIKVFRADQTFKFLPIFKDTTAREVVMLALQEFNITDPSSNYSLCEVTVENQDLIKQKRLPDTLSNLPERQNLNGRRTVPSVLRYYLKNNMNTETLVPDELRGELIKEAHISLLHLNTTEVASQLTLEDFKVFKSIEQTEYIDDLFSLKSQYGTPNLDKFTELVNKEMFWVVTEVCGEANLVRRMKIIKNFIKIARHCKDCKNFNSMFAILSGLSHSCVDRLRNTWEKLPSKYEKMYNDLKDLMDPSRNMSKYRNLINSESVQPPILPFFPVAKKDLTFIHLGNDTKVEGLINMEKFRMIAKEVRQICNMCSAKYDVTTMFLGTPSMQESSWISGGMATMKRVKNRRASTVPNTKKMYEEAQMRRRVKSYLSNMKVIQDEEKLKEMSHQCEPPVRKVEHSPNVMASTSNLSTVEDKRSTAPSGPKFGAESPDAIRKLMGLTASVKPHKSNHPLPPAPVASPLLSSGRRPPTSPRHQPPAMRSHPLHLSPESSSVISLSNIAYRKPHRTVSLGSQESISSTGSTTYQPSNAHRHTHPDSDSGRQSMSSSNYSMLSSNYDSHSTNSVGSNHSASHSPPARKPQSATSPSFSHNTSQPPLPQPAVRPPLPPYHVVVQNSPAYSQYIHQTYTNVRRPPLPDYHSATQMAHMARQRHQWQMERARSHEGVLPYCNGQSKFMAPEEGRCLQV